MRVGRGAGQGALSWSRTALGAKVRDDVRVPEGLFIGVGIDCYISSDSPDLSGSADEVQAIARLVGEHFSTCVLRDPDEATVSTTHFLDWKALCRRVIRLPSFVYAHPSPRHSSVTVTLLRPSGRSRSGRQHPIRGRISGTAMQLRNGVSGAVRSSWISSARRQRRRSRAENAARTGTTAVSDGPGKQGRNRTALNFSRITAN